MRDAEDKALNHGGVADQAAADQAAAAKPSAKPEEGKPGVADQAKKSAEAAKKSWCRCKSWSKSSSKNTRC